MARPTLSPTGIRTDLVSRLAGKTIAADRVFNSRRANLETDELPAITVTSLGATDDRWSMGTFLAKHTERLAIVGDVANEDGDEAALAADLDIMESQILDALAGDAEWLGAFESVEKIDSAKRLDDSSGTLLGHVGIVVELHYSVQFPYATSQAPEGTPPGPGQGGTPMPPDLESIRVDTHSAHPIGADVSDRPVLDHEEG